MFGEGVSESRKRRIKVSRMRKFDRKGIEGSVNKLRQRIVRQRVGVFSPIYRFRIMAKVYFQRPPKPLGPMPHIPYIDMFSIVITTFEGRFRLYLFPLLRELSKLEGVHVTLIVNAPLTTQREKKLRASLLRVLARYPRVSPVFMHTFSGCSRMWNVAMNMAEADGLIFLNDDVVVNARKLSTEIPQIVEEMYERGLVKINGNFSHFALSRDAWLKIGGFEERFLGIGEEDGDFQFRFEESLQELPAAFNSGAISNLGSGSMGDVGANGSGKYSLFNLVFRRLKYVDHDGGITGIFEGPKNRLLETPAPGDFTFKKKFLPLLLEADEELIRRELEDWVEDRRGKSAR